jgi:hypothetical protein
MTLAHLEKRLNRIEQKLDDLHSTFEYAQAIDGIRRGLESANRGEGEKAQSAFSDIRRKHRARQK